MNKSLRHRYIEIGIHLLVWGVIINMPLLSSGEQHMTVSQYLRSIFFPTLFAIAFYTNYVYLIPRLLLSKKLTLFFVVNLILFAAYIFVLERGRDFYRPNFAEMKHMQMNGNVPSGMPRPPNGGPPPGMILGAFLAFAMTTGVAVAIHSTTQWFKSEDIRKDLEHEHLKSELDNLKNQVNPHFFFNTLNNIYSLIVQNQQKAQDAVHQLSKIMRYLLYESNEKFVPLNKEIQFIHHYIDLMKLRVTSNVTIRYTLQTEGRNVNIAPLLFISLIENSFKHGISANKPSEIEMDLKITPQRELIFHIKNTFFPKADSDRSGSGIGLGNLKKRLALLYPSKHSLEAWSDENYFQTVLTLKL